MIFSYKNILFFIASLAIFFISSSIKKSFAQECNIIYVSPTGASSGLAGTKANPATLPYAFTLANATNNQLRLAVGDYSISNELSMISGITMDGGFDPTNNWEKTNSLHTIIFRDSTNTDPLPNRILAVECLNISNFSIHDLTIIVGDATPSINSVTTYGIHLFDCMSYNFSRLTITSGNGTDGIDGVPGANGVNGANGTFGELGDEDGGCCTAGGTGGSGSYPGSNFGGAGGNGGARGTGKCFGSGNNTAPNAANGQMGLGIGGGLGGVGGAGLCASFFSIGCDQTPANNGADGADGMNGADGVNGANGVFVFSNYFIPGDGADGQQGNHGGGGGGGGGGGSQGCITTCFGDNNGAGPGGGGGGEGGQGGFGATGGKGGGGSFAIYIDSNGVNTALKDCLLNSGQQGNGSYGGTPGGIGGGSSGAGAGSPGCDIGKAGKGGAGGTGGLGANGGNGIPGVSLPLFEDPAGIAIAQSDMKANVEPTIYVQNSGCTFSDVNYTTNATGIIQWFFDGGAIPLSGSGDTVMTQYDIMGRHSITLVVDGVPYMFTDFTGVFSDGTIVLPSISGSDTVCPGSTESYSALFPSSFTVLDYEWKMYNPGSLIANQVGSSPSFVYSFPTTTGKYMVTLKTKSPCCGWSKIDTFYVAVVPFLPTDVYVSASAPIICEGEQATFFAIPLNGGNNPSYQWNVNGLNSGGTTNIFQSSALNNNDAITCIMTSSYPCPLNTPASSLPFIIAVNSPPSVVCSSVNNYLGGVTGFSAILSGGASPYLYNWNFGDGGTDTSNAPFHLYGGTGQYNYSLTVTDTNGCLGICTNTLNIVIAPFVNAGLTYNQTRLCGSTSVIFTDTSIGAATWWQWDFGDGSAPSSLQNPTHIYVTPGYYTVTLIAGNAIYSDTLVSPNIISVFVVPAANISFINDTICFPLTQNFFDISPNSSSWLWDFGDGSIGSSLQNPFHKYAAPGTYPITLTVNSIDGCSDIATSTVIVLPAPKASFSQSAATICSGGTVVFTDISNNAIQWNWNFGDGSSFLGAAPPMHVYSTQGVYNVSLSVENALGCKDDTTILAAVNVNLRPDALFQISTLENIHAGTEVLFENQSVNYNEWLWNFGNGSFDSINVNAKVVYSNPGVYNVMLYAIYGPDCLDSMLLKVTVNDFESIYVPAAFTPNGDNVNDVFLARGNGLTGFKMYVFNRWGEVLFKSVDINDGWDGKVQDKLVPDGVYSYRILYSKKSIPLEKYEKIGSFVLLNNEF